MSKAWTRRETGVDHGQTVIAFDALPSDCQLLFHRSSEGENQIRDCWELKGAIKFEAATANLMFTPLLWYFDVSCPETL